MRIKGRSILTNNVAKRMLDKLKEHRTWFTSFSDRIQDSLTVSAYRTSKGIRVNLKTQFLLTKNLNESRWFSSHDPKFQDKIAGFIGRNLLKALELKSLVKPKQELEDLATQQIDEDDEEFMCFIDAKGKELNIPTAYDEMSSSDIQRWLFLIAEYRVKYLKQKEVA